MNLATRVLVAAVLDSRHVALQQGDKPRHHAYAGVGHLRERITLISRLVDLDQFQAIAAVSMWRWHSDRYRDKRACRSQLLPYAHVGAEFG